MRVFLAASQGDLIKLHYKLNDTPTLMFRYKYAPASPTHRLVVGAGATLPQGTGPSAGPANRGVALSSMSHWSEAPASELPPSPSHHTAHPFPLRLTRQNRLRGPRSLGASQPGPQLPRAPAERQGGRANGE